MLGSRRGGGVRRRLLRIVTLGVAALAVSVALTGTALAAPPPYLSHFSATTTLSSTVPGNGDQNPYGIVSAPRTIGALHAGDILVSNFNNQGPVDSMGNPTSGGNQGEGTTIVQFNRHGGNMRVFAQINPSLFNGAVGLTTALAALPDGYVVVGSLPTTDGSSATMTAGELIVLNPWGQVVGAISGGPINGPWDMTAVTTGPITTLFVTNVLNGPVTTSTGSTPVPLGTVVRIRLWTGFGPPFLLSERVIATGFDEHADPSALVVGPTGVGLGWNGTLYVADSANDRIAAIPDAMFRHSVLGGGGFTLTQGMWLSDPLGLTIAPGGDILTANGNNGNVVETTPFGQQVDRMAIDNGNGTGAGDLFGIAVPPNDNGLLFVDDFDNTLRLLH
jgi:hypothetical protein